MPLVAAAVAAFSGCEFGGSGPDPVARTVNIAARMIYPAGGAPRCSGQLKWRYEPMSLAGGADGETNAVTHDRPYTGIATSDECHFEDAAFGLQPGRWRITAESFAGIQGRCEQNLRPTAIGLSISFREGRPGCQVYP